MNDKYFMNKTYARTLLAMITLLAVQSSAHSIMFIDTSNNAWHNQAHWLIGTPYLWIIASNESLLENFGNIYTLEILSKWYPTDDY